MSFMKCYVIAGLRPPWNMDVFLKGFTQKQPPGFEKQIGLPPGIEWQIGTAEGVPHFATASEASAWAAGIGTKDFAPVEHLVVSP